MDGARAVLDTFDSDGDGVVDYSEFLYIFVDRQAIVRKWAAAAGALRKLCVDYCWGRKVSRSCTHPRHAIVIMVATLTIAESHYSRVPHCYCLPSMECFDINGVRVGRHSDTV